jgi:hypothetical protein
MEVGQPECGAGRASPAKWSNTDPGKKKEPNIRSSGCRLQFGGAEWSSSAITLQNSSTIFRHAVRATQLKVLGALFSPQRCDARHFILNGAARNSALALH